jgi:hypothetical protein
MPSPLYSKNNMTYRIYSAFIVLAGLLLSGTAASAQTSGICTAGTLASYIASNGCVNGIEFFTFQPLTTSGNGVVYSASNIEVDPVSFSDGESAGFTFCIVQSMPGCSNVTLPFEVATGETATYDIAYLFSFVIDPRGTQASEGMDPPFGDVSINQYYCADAGLTQSSPVATPICNAMGHSFGPQTLNVNDNNPPASWNTGIVPLNPVINESASIVTMINLNGINGAAGFDNVTNANYVDNFVPSPEPSAIVLAAGGLLALALRRRFC